MIEVIDPIKFGKFCWPDITFYRQQREIIYSVRDNDETFVPAGNMLGKDFVAAFIALWFFVSRHPCRVVTTSVDGTQLESVLWGEIRRFVQSSRYELPIVNNHLHIRKVVKGQVDGLSYLLGRVAAKGEGMLGHHIAKTGDGIVRTLFIADEASGVEDISYDRADTWAERKLVIGNPYPCTNFFFRGVKAGPREADDNGRFYRNVIKIKAEDSPNVRLAEAEVKAGKRPSGKMLIPGVMNYTAYRKRRALWDPVRQCIGLDAEFYEGAEQLMFPPIWLDAAERAAKLLRAKRRTARTIGIDTAEGGDNTVWAVVDNQGLIELRSMKTPDTSIITGQTIALMKQYNVAAKCVLFDRGGGGKEHADRLRRQGYNVRTVGFGESASPEKRHGVRTLDQRKREDETRYAYRNRRAEMYGLLRLALEPERKDNKDLIGKFGLPSVIVNRARPDGGPSLRAQLSPIPLSFDEEGRLELLPKRRRDPNSRKRSLEELVGCSPDEADALALAIFGMRRPVYRFQVKPW